MLLALTSAASIGSAFAATPDLPDSGVSLDQVATVLAPLAESDARENLNPYTGAKIGMGTYIFNLMCGAAANPDCTGSYVLKCDGEVVAEVAASKADAGVGFSPAGYAFSVNFGVPLGAESLSEIPEKFLKEGKWTLTVPDRALMIGRYDVTGQEQGGTGDIVFTPEAYLSGATFTYVNKASNAEKVWVLDPPAGSVVTDLNYIKITFPEEKYLGYNRVTGTLTHPDGTVQALNKYMQRKDGWVYGMTNWGYIAPDRKIETFLPGEYRLHIDAGSLYAGGQVAWTGTEGNVGAIDAVFIVDISNTVAILGLEGADSYTVVSLDGKVLMNQAPSTSLSTLSKGIYLINGKKVRVL